jgi:hypothetical protein
MMKLDRSSTDAETKQPLVLGPEVLRKSRDPRAPDVTVVDPPQYRPLAENLQIARRTDNECIYFDEKHTASWIIYPPRSRYSFVPRPNSDATVVEYRRWTPMTPSVIHQLTISAGCAEHGAECPSTVAVSLAVRDGYNPFL